MASVNKAIILGNCGKDPEARFLPDGGQITNVSIATSYKWKDKASGENKEETEWHKVVFFGRLAEVAGEYLKKGSPVFIEGRIKTRKWQDKEGQDRYSTEIVAEQMQLLGSKSDAQQAGSPPPPKRTPGPASSIADMSNDVPFVHASPSFDLEARLTRRMRRYA